VSLPGVYWVTVEDNNGCTGSDTLEVMLSPAVMVSLGGDTTICSGDNYVLNPGGGFLSYLWQDGSTGTSFPVNQPGIYWVNVTDGYGCTGGDTVHIGINPSPQVNLGSDTVLCTGDILVLDPGSQYSSYLWQDNSSLPVYTVTSTGYYSVTVTNLFECGASDEVYVQVTSPEIDLGPDTILCQGDTLYLDPGQGYDSYQWQDGSTSPVYQLTGGGSYWVVVTDSYNCTSQENIEIIALEKPVADLGDDQVLCTGESLVLESPEGPYNYLWNGQPGGSSMMVYTGGTYEVEVSNACGNETDGITVTEQAVPQVDLGADQVLQPGEMIQLDGGPDHDQYTWQDGAPGQYYEVSSATVEEGVGVYWVEVWDGPCKNSDTIQVEVFRVKVPNVITPNGDGANDTFRPMEGSWSGITRHHMEIYNRWGEKVWESDDFESGWDGKLNGSLVAEGTYFWLLDVFYGPDDIKKTFKGTVTLLMGHN
jgi:gliding motility-associated-like protein